jgi:hypothetical protein
VIAGLRGPGILRAARVWLAIAALALAIAAAFARTPSPDASVRATKPSMVRPGDGC